MSSIPFTRSLVRSAAAGIAGIAVLAASVGTANAVVFSERHTLSIDPNHGFAGTTVLVKSNEGCKAPEGSTDWQAVVWIERNGRLLDNVYVVPSASSEWQWSARVTVPADTSAGPVAITANCFDQAGSAPRSEDVRYEPATFIVEEKPAAVTPPSPNREPSRQPTSQPTPPKAKPGTKPFTG
jgi:hypothetical protein